MEVSHVSEVGFGDLNDSFRLVSNVPTIAESIRNISGHMPKKIRKGGCFLDVCAVDDRLEISLKGLDEVN